MTATKLPAILALVCAIVVALPTTQAQNIDWQGQDSEFGSIRAPFSAVMDGERVPIEARVVLRDNYENKESRFFMFGFIVENTPLDVTFDKVVRTDTGEEMICYQREGDSRTALKCHVDLKNMPPAGTEIRMHGTVGSSRLGTFNVGAIVVPFTYTWMRVQMSNGLNAELYAYTAVNVQTATGGSGTIAGIGNKVPEVGAIGVVAASIVASALIMTHRRRK